MPERLSGCSSSSLLSNTLEAFRDGQFLVNEGSSMKRGLKCIGICPWGYIHNTMALVNDQVAEFQAAR